MAIDRIKAKTLSLVVDGDRQIVIKTSSKRNADLNRELLKPERFQEFVENPKRFAARFDITIDREISDQLHAKLQGIESLEVARRFVNPGDLVAATVWAVAVGSFSVASTKIAVAF